MSMETQAYFCPSCYSDDYAWLDGKYTMVHDDGCAEQASQGSETSP